MVSMAAMATVKRILRWLGLIVFLSGTLFLLFQQGDFTGLPSIFQPRVFHTVVIDAGHGGKDPGAVGAGVLEKELTLDLARRLDRKLAGAGMRTVMTRSDDRFLPLEQRVRIASRQGNAIFLSLHFNRESTGTVSGVETFFHDPNQPLAGEADTGGGSGNHIPGESETLAAFVHARLLERLQPDDRGIKNYDYHVLRHASTPAILVEGGFLSHPMEKELIANGGYLDQMAEAIKDGVVDYRRRKQTE